MNEINQTRCVKTTCGWVRGFHGQTPSTTVFKGIPYAAPPVGELRFQPPQDPKPWKDTRDCFIYAPAPIQSKSVKGTFYQKEFYPVQRNMSEDCLYLNIWTPATYDTQRLPVMVWFHGGGFGGGSADEICFDGEAMARRGVILVTVGYRVNIFSAFVSVSSSLRGNCGSRDQIKSLQWVKENIEAFGGDKNNVTIFGQSAGAVAVETLMGSPLAKGLFHKAIVQSCGGTLTLSGYRTIEMADHATKEFLEESHLTVDEARKLDAEQLFALFSEYEKKHHGSNCYPMIDGELLLDSPGNGIRNASVPDVPYMSGTVDGDPFFETISLCDTFEEQKEAVHRFFQDSEKAEEFIHEFLSNDTSMVSFKREIEDLLQIGASESFGMSLSDQKELVYLYRFNRYCPGKDCRGEKDGKGYHSFELWYIFGTIAHCWRPLTGVDYDISNAMCDYWCSFATYGDPNQIGEHPSWPRYTKENPLTLEISEKGFLPKVQIDTEMKRVVLDEMLRRGEE